MTDVHLITFDFQELYIALDAERHRRGMSWKQAAEEMGPSVTTIKNTAKSDKMEADGVMGMLQWLGVPASTFTRGGDPQPDLATQFDTLLRAREDLAADAAAQLSSVARTAYERLRSDGVTPQEPRAPSTRHRVLGYKRLHIGGIFAALEAKREAADKTWDEVAKEIHPLLVTSQTVRRLAQGGRTAVPAILLKLEWLGLPPEVFLRHLAPPEVRIEPELPPPDLMDQVAVLLRARDDLSDESVAELEGAIRSEYHAYELRREHHDSTTRERVPSPNRRRADRPRRALSDQPLPCP